MFEHPAKGPRAVAAAEPTVKKSGKKKTSSARVGRRQLTATCRDTWSTKDEIGPPDP